MSCRLVTIANNNNNNNNNNFLVDHSVSALTSSRCLKLCLMDLAHSRRSLPVIFGMSFICLVCALYLTRTQLSVPGSLSLRFPFSPSFPSFLFCLCFPFPLIYPILSIDPFCHPFLRSNDKAPSHWGLEYHPWKLFDI